MSSSVTTEKLAQHLGAELQGAAHTVIKGAAPLETAGSEDVTFLARRKYLPFLNATRAAAVIVGRNVGSLEPTSSAAALLWVDDAHQALADTLALLYPEKSLPPGIAATAVLGTGVKLGEGVTVGPYSVVGAQVELADGARVGAHCRVGDGCRIGAQTELKDQVTLYSGTEVGARCIIHSGARLGVDGYGYVFQDGRHRKIPQVGRCVIEDDVEVGANSCIDRGSVGETRIGAGTKIDNLVHIAHNVRIGRNCLIVAQVGIAGSTMVGDGVALAGQVGIIGHLKVGDGARVAAQAGVSQDVPAGETWFGHPARPLKRVMRANAAFLKLPDVMRRLQRLEKRLGADPAELD